jgi:hypothetical protein
MATERRAHFLKMTALAAALAGTAACLAVPVGQVSTTGGSAGGSGSSGGGNSGTGGGNSASNGGTSAGTQTGGSPTLSLSSQAGPSTVMATSPNPCEIDLDFGSVAIGQMENATLQLTNPGTSAIYLVQVDPNLDPEFEFTYANPQAIQPGESGDFSLSFQPYKVGQVTSQFTIQSSGQNPDCPAPARGSGDSLTIVLTADGVEQP